MAPRKSVEQKLEELDSLSAAVDRPEQSSRLAAALEDRHYRVVAKAAVLAAQSLLYELMPALTAAFPRFLEKGQKGDPSCIAKGAIARALVELDCDDVELFRAGLGCRQLEPVYGGSVNTATDVRCSCAMGLVASGYPRALVDVAELLSDPEPQARAGAVRAIACGNPREAEPLLRAKALLGDEEPTVIGDCFAGLLAVEPDESPAFVARFLARHNDEAIRELAALALGESRLPASFDHLQAAWDDVLPSRAFRRALMCAAAFHRSDAAADWLVSFVAEGNEHNAEDALEALALYHRDPQVARRVEAEIGRLTDRELAARLGEHWAGIAARPGER